MLNKIKLIITLVAMNVVFGPGRGILQEQIRASSSSHMSLSIISKADISSKVAEILQGQRYIDKSVDTGILDSPKKLVLAVKTKTVSEFEDKFMQSKNELMNSPINWERSTFGEHLAFRCQEMPCLKLELGTLGSLNGFLNFAPPESFGDLGKILQDTMYRRYHLHETIIDGRLAHYYIGNTEVQNEINRTLDCLTSMQRLGLEIPMGIEIPEVPILVMAQIVAKNTNPIDILGIRVFSEARGRYIENDVDLTGIHRTLQNICHGMINDEIDRRGFDNLDLRFFIGEFQLRQIPDILKQFTRDCKGEIRTFYSEIRFSRTWESSCQNITERYGPFPFVVMAFGIASIRSYIWA